MTLAMIGWYALPACAESACYRSVAEAAHQTGRQDAAGYRVAKAHQDAFSGASWTTVVSCAHPERPGVLVQGAPARRRAPGPWLVAVGSEVQLLRVEASMRMELTGTALANGTLGDRVRVRVQGTLNGAQDRVVAGIVKADGTLELED